MFLTLLAISGLVSVIAAASRDKLGKAVFYIAATPLAAAAVVSASWLPDNLPSSQSVSWVDNAGLIFNFAPGSFQAVVSFLVAAIGALIMVYAAGYFGNDREGTGRFAAVLSLFAASMLGLVWAGNIWTLFIFWELTSITSFLLIGHKSTKPSALQSARRALVITAGGGLCLLGGLLILAEGNASTAFTSLSAPTGATGTAAVVLIITAIATKSAQFPFHIWLPGAMDAPTPVSAYLHSATMVKAGIILLALLTPTFASSETWSTAAIAIGVITMLWGAIGALRQFDAKLILAWGTVSQLGLIVTLLGLGEPKAVFAGVSLFVAHAIFKAALFMVVGEIDIRTKTRDIRELSGLAKSMPVAFFVALVSGLSMAGIPPLLGFAAKEAAVEAVLKLEGLTLWTTGAAIIFGSVLTVAYTTRLLIGVFGSSEGRSIEVAKVRLEMTAPAAVLGTASFLGYVFIDQINTLVIEASGEINSQAELYVLYRWPGITDAFLISVAVVLAGTIVGALVSRSKVSEARALGAELVDKAVDGTIRFAGKFTRVVQHGSLPIYVVVMSLVAAASTIPFWFSLEIDGLYRYDNNAQVVLAIFIGLAALVVAFTKSRLGAVLALGFVGLGMAGLFINHGAADLALTQLLVETIIVVGFVLGFSHLSSSFPPVGRIWQEIRIVVSVLVATGVGVGLVAVSSSDVNSKPVDDFFSQSVTTGGGNNVVNVILTDMRALDTLGEVVVLAVVVVGIVALSKAVKEHKTVGVER